MKKTVRYYIKTKNGFTLCKPTVQELLKTYYSELLYGETIQIIEQTQIWGKDNVDKVIAVFTVGGALWD